MEMEIIQKYFPDLKSEQLEKITRIGTLYNFWNPQINVISRKDIIHLYERHVLHSLSIARIIRFRPGTRILDVGTGGGFPGIPLAIIFPEADFLLIDSIGKKIKVVKEIAGDLNLPNIVAEHIRAEQVTGKFDFVVSRAVTSLPRLIRWVKKNISSGQQNSLPNGLLYLKGGEIEEDIKPFKRIVQVFDLSVFFQESFFETKKLIFIPL
jgi:16S rRNA (guanine527-N7)-methyltransferase